MLLLIAPEHEAVSDIDQIVIRLYIEYQEAVERLSDAASGKIRRMSQMHLKF